MAVPVRSQKRLPYIIIVVIIITIIKFVVIIVIITIIIVVIIVIIIIIIIIILSIPNWCTKHRISVVLIYYGRQASSFKFIQNLKI